MRFDGTEPEPQSIEEEAWEQNRVKPKFKERNWDAQPDPRYEEDEHEERFRHGGSVFWG